jgi:hypothetical protein
LKGRVKGPISTSVEEAHPGATLITQSVVCSKNLVDFTLLDPLKTAPSPSNITLVERVLRPREPRTDAVVEDYTKDAVVLNQVVVIEDPASQFHLLEEEMAIARENLRSPPMFYNLP